LAKSREKVFDEIIEKIQSIIAEKMALTSMHKDIRPMAYVFIKFFIIFDA